MNDAQHFLRSATLEELSTLRASTPEKVTLNVALLPRAKGVSTLRATHTNSSMRYRAPSTVGCSRMYEGKGPNSDRHSMPARRNSAFVGRCCFWSKSSSAFDILTSSGSLFSVKTDVQAIETASHAHRVSCKGPPTPSCGELVSSGGRCSGPYLRTCASTRPSKGLGISLMSWYVSRDASRRPLQGVVTLRSE